MVFSFSCIIYTRKGSGLSVTCTRPENVEFGTLANQLVTPSGSIQSENGTLSRFFLQRSRLFPNDLQNSISEVASIESSIPDMLNRNLSHNPGNNSNENHFSDPSSEESLSDVDYQHPSHVTQIVICKDGSSFYEPLPDYPMEDE